MNHSQQPILRRLLARIDAFRVGAVDLPSLQHEFGAAAGALEGDVPKEVRDSADNTEAQLDYVRFVTVGARQRDLALAAAADFEAIVARTCGNARTTDDDGA